MNCKNEQKPKMEPLPGLHSELNALQALERGDRKPLIETLTTRFENAEATKLVKLQPEVYQN